jgi:hypothetical protein
MSNKSLWSKKWFIKKGATDPPLYVQLVREDNNVPLNISGASVSFTMKRDGATNPVLDEVTATLTDAANGIIAYEWNSSPLTGTEKAGKFKAEFTITLSNGKIIKQPQNGYIEIYVVEDLS